MAVAYDAVIIVEGWGMFTDSFNQTQCLDIIPPPITSRVILNTKAAGEITIITPNQVIVDFNSQDPFIAGAVKVKFIGQQLITQKDKQY
jgi:hypothetical protein